ncbi:hypothetical protein [Vibrio sp. SCSIO 43136]|uniref:hypothetical protein n=1 Tax=Vibrio sp. SCSIO 43136 TaxID=2819101 RepID=UPI002075A539|nr:hypothetical protein [Vibrio sp. SCSIO 43136]USD66790.1 hypothetical protein J4N39_19225 [Vibrio sp. SCSIO 43136]
MKACFLVAVMVLVTACTDSNELAKQKLSISLGAQPSSSLVKLAIDSRQFDKHALTVEPDIHISGKVALKTAIKNQAAPDVLFASNIAFLANQHLLPDYRIVATVFESDNINALSSLTSFNDLHALEGKTLCTQYLSALHFFGQTLAQRNGVRNLEFKYFKLGDLNKKMISGECDFITTRQPFIEELSALTQRQHGLAFYPGTYLQYELMLVHNRVSDAIIERFILGLLDTEEYLIKTISEVENEPCQFDDICILHNKELLAHSVLEVSLYQTLIPLLDRELEWLKRKAEVQTELVNTHHLFRTSPLSNVAPHRMTVMSYVD